MGVIKVGPGTPHRHRRIGPEVAPLVAGQPKAEIRGRRGLQGQGLGTATRGPTLTPALISAPDQRPLPRPRSPDLDPGPFSGPGPIPRHAPGCRPPTPNSTLARVGPTRGPTPAPRPRPTPGPCVPSKPRPSPRPALARTPDPHSSPRSNAHLRDDVVQVAERGLVQQLRRQRRPPNHRSQGLLRPPHHRRVHGGDPPGPPSLSPASPPLPPCSRRPLRPVRPARVSIPQCTGVRHGACAGPRRPVSRAARP